MPPSDPAARTPRETERRGKHVVHSLTGDTEVVALTRRLDAVLLAWVTRRAASFLHEAAAFDRLAKILAFGRKGRFREFMLRPAGLQPGEAVLDVACGTETLANRGEPPGPTTMNFFRDGPA